VQGSETGRHVGSSPSNGEVVRGLRLLSTTRSKDATVVNTLLYYFNPFDLARWTDVSVVDARTGEPLATRRFSKPRYAVRARKSFVAAVSRLSADDYLAADWQEFLDAADTGR
jgi:hypothetical protein